MYTFLLNQAVCLAVVANRDAFFVHLALVTSFFLFEGHFAIFLREPSFSHTSRLLGNQGIELHRLQDDVDFPFHPVAQCCRGFFHKIFDDLNPNLILILCAIIF